MKRKLLPAVAIFFAVAIMGAVLFSMYRWGNGSGLLQRSEALVGKSKAEALRQLGQPENTLSQADYQSERSKIAVSYEPDPPAVECEEVLQFREGTRIALLFVTEGRVTQVYTGLT